MSLRNKEILLCYLEEDLNMEQLARRFDISHSRVGQTISQELHRLRCSDVSTPSRRIEARQRLHSLIIDNAQYEPDWTSTPAGFYHMERGLSNENELAKAYGRKLPEYL
jgi:hypothetical protein